MDKIELFIRIIANKKWMTEEFLLGLLVIIIFAICFVYSALYK